VKVVIAGSRSITKEVFDQVITQCPWADLITEVVLGACPTGVDAHGLKWAKSKGLPTKDIHADWSQGKKGGPQRNARMAEYADGLIAIWDGVSPGTRWMAKSAHKRGLRCWLFDASKGTIRESSETGVLIEDWHDAVHRAGMKEF